MPVSYSWQRLWQICLLAVPVSQCSLYSIFDMIKLSVLLERMPNILVEVYRPLQETYCPPPSIFSSVFKLYSCGRSVHAYQTARRHTTEDSILHNIHPEKSKFRVAEKMIWRRKLQQIWTRQSGWRLLYCLMWRRVVWQKDKAVESYFMIQLSLFK